MDVPNHRDGDTLGNVQQAYQAVSIYGNRAWIFTPLLLTRQHLFEGCAGLDGQPAGELLVVEGNTGLLPKRAAVRSDPYGSSHDPEAGIWSLAHHAINRDVLRYALHEQARQEFRSRLCAQHSVFLRRQRAPANDHENQQARWLAPGIAGPQQEPNALDCGWPWFVVWTDRPVLAVHAVAIGRYPNCSNMPLAQSEAQAMRLDRVGLSCLITLATTLAITLAGCASLSDTAVPLDSALPAGAKSPCPARLAAGASCVALVQAARWQSRAGIQLARGATCCAQVPPGQGWFDKDRPQHTATR